MADAYCKSVIHLAVAQICKSLGWDAINSSAFEILVDFTERHLLTVGSQTQRYAEQFGSANGTLDDLDVAFNELQIDKSELYEYMKNVEPITLPQPVTQLEAPSQNQLIYPQCSEDENLTKGLQAPTMSGLVNSPAAHGKPTASPIRTPSRQRLPVDVENQKFRMRSHLMLEDGELSVLFNKGTLPSSAPPPQPPPEMRIPKLKPEPVSHKPKLKTGAFKPMMKESSPVETVTTEPVVVVEKIQDDNKLPKPPVKKKKKKPQAAPEGFQDIFGATLEKPKVKSLERQCSVTIEKMEIYDAPIPSAPADVEPDISPNFTEEVSDLPIDDHNPLVQERLLRIDDTIERVMQFTRIEIDKKEEAEQAFSFDDRPITPVGIAKSRVKVQPSSSNIDDTIDAVLSQSSPVTETTDIPELEALEKSPTVNKAKEKKKKKSKREKLLEEFAAAPIESFSAESQIEKDFDHSPNIGPNVTPAIENQTQIFTETVQPLQEAEVDDEAGIVNVDGEDSDVDVLEVSSPIPLPANPYADMTEMTLHEESFEQEEAYVSPVHQSVAPINLEVPIEDWDMNQSSQQDYDIGDGQVIDFASAQFSEKKEKHKKEKKEKKEKKKKKHKEKDRDEKSHKHKHKDKTAHTVAAADEESFPKLTLKIGGQTVNEEAEGIVPKLVIKPFGSDANPYTESITDSHTENMNLTSITVEGDRVWICPACGKLDDGSPMIGCDSCDEWYHWVCVNITSQPPEDIEWHCPKCERRAVEKIKKKKKKKHKHE